MSESEEDKDSKTEEPSHRKLEEALEKGQVISSREVNNAFVLVVLTIMLAWVLPLIFNYSAIKLKLVIENAGQINLDQGQAWNVISSLLGGAILALSPLFVLIIAAVIFSAMLQQGQFTFSFDSVQPDLSRISIFSGIKKIFSTRSLVDLLKNLLKITLVGIFLYLIVSADVQGLRMYQDMSIGLILSQFHSIVNHVMICTAITAIVLAVIDYSYQRFEYFKSLRMSKHELKEEHKQSEGDPIVKRRIREIRRARAQKNIAQNVPKADVIITNPTHYAIAIKYDADTMPAPMITAKGQDLMAAKIRELAEEHDIPMVENAPLARALYKVDEMEYVPHEHYEAIAKVIGYVYYLNEKKGKKRK
jgi:flagellar biosynthetic protein FlhB